MRHSHWPYSLKRFINGCNRFYTHYFLRPQFAHWGTNVQVVCPRHVVIFGEHIHLGNCAHIISASDNPVRFTTWRSKNLCGHIHISNYCLISPGVRLSAADSISIGNNCMLAANVYISDSDWHGIYNRIRPFRCTQKVTLGNNVWVGDSAIITKGVNIGDNSIIGAGAVVTDDIPANVVAAGNPARVVKKLNPKRRMLKREHLFMSIDNYQRQQQLLDEYALGNNSWLGWLRSVFLPSNRD